MAVFPYARSGMVSAVMLGLGRALGETMAVAMILSATPIVTLNIISGQSPATIASNIAVNYKEATLLKVFPRYFGPGKENAAEYAGKPEKIANYVYMDKNRSKGGALGNVKEGDGWLFSGKGLKQVTGRSNTTAFGKTVGKTAEEAAVYLLTKKGALESALWFWGSRNLNEVADTGDVTRLTKIINGGNIGLADRQARYAKAMAALGGKISAAAPVNPQITDAVTQVLRKGSKGALVKKLQAALNVGADGDFGQGTENALKKWQARNGLTADGVAGPKTLAKLLG